MHEDCEAGRRRLAWLHRCFHRSAILVAEDDDEFRVAVGDRVFDARQFEISRYVSRHANHEELIERAIENQLGRNAAVGARQNRDGRILMIGRMVAQVAEMIECDLSRDVCAIAVHERLPERVGVLRDGRRRETQSQQNVTHRRSI